MCEGCGRGGEDSVGRGARAQRAPWWALRRRCVRQRCQWLAGQRCLHVELVCSRMVLQRRLQVADVINHVLDYLQF